MRAITHKCTKLGGSEPSQEWPAYKNYSQELIDDSSSRSQTDPQQQLKNCRPHLFQLRSAFISMGECHSKQPQKEHNGSSHICQKTSVWSQRKIELFNFAKKSRPKWAKIPDRKDSLPFILDCSSSCQGWDNQLSGLGGINFFTQDQVGLDNFFHDKWKSLFDKCFCIY